MTTSATSTRFPVGAMPGSIQSISMLWVNLSTISSTSWSTPTVRETGTISMSGGIFGMKCVE